MPNFVTAKALKTMLHDGDEIAVLDVREEGVFARRHMLLASNAPLSRLELRIPLLVPRRSTRLVLVDAADDRSQRAADVLSANGYTQIHILTEGIEGWAAAGYPVYSGMNVPSKAFGEFVEHHYGTPHIDARELQGRVAAGEKLVLLDSRPLAEYRKMSIPGGIDCPGAELVYRVPDLLKSPEALVVVNCAGRTRSIIGAQSLINAGIPNKVVALKNGTMGWHLAGFKLAHNQDEIAPAPGLAALNQAKRSVRRVARRFGVRYATVAQVREFVRQLDERTLYLFDVRSPEEYEAGHLHSTISAPGGQLVQATDSYMATRNARVLLVDDNGVRATMTASWLIQMGWKEVYVVKEALAAGPAHKGQEATEVLGLDKTTCEFTSPAALEQLLKERRAVVLDFDVSLKYRDGHIPGAWLSIRANVRENLKKIPSAEMTVLTSQDGIIARLAAAEIARLTDSNVVVLQGGTRAWRDAGLPLETGLDRLVDTTEDAWYRPYDRVANVEEAMKDYLSWEVDLVKQIEQDEDANFLHFPR